MEKNMNVVEKRCNQLLEKAWMDDATDIHLVPSKDYYEVLFRKGAKLQRHGTLLPQLADRMISYFKFLSSLDISNKRKPQSGSFHRQMQGERFSCRVSTIPAIHFKESIVIRLQKHDRIVPIDKLCLKKEWADKLINATSMQQGLCLLSGPTGSGKTTTMYTLMAHCAHHLDRHVITLEDPVENNQSHLLQVQVNERAGMSYAMGLKAILRHSPDVIMIGEIRDEETAKVAVQAALTGHLVFASLHAKNPEGCLYRMADFGVSAEELRQTIICLSAQRLIRTSDDGLGAVFEIVDGPLLESMTDAFVKGERFMHTEKSEIDTLVHIHNRKMTHEK